MGTRKSIPVGTVFSGWTVIAEAEPGFEKNGQMVSYSQCRCECGVVANVRNNSLKRKQSTSCGCKRTEKVIASRVSHGATRFGKTATEYKAWQSMMLRTGNSNTRSFPRYGGRGITVCDRWLNSFEAFLEDMGQRPSSEHSIDRIDNNGNYEPTNCRWATRSEQQNNRAVSRHLVVHGVKKSLPEWAREVGIHSKTIHERLRRGWSDEDAVMRPAYGRRTT